MKNTTRVIKVADDILLIHNCKIDDIYDIVDKLFIDINYSVITNDEVCATGLYILDSSGFVYSETLYHFIKNKMNSKLVSKLKANVKFTALPRHLQQLLLYVCKDKKSVSVLDCDLFSWTKDDMKILKIEINKFNFQNLITLSKNKIIISNGIHNHVNYIN